MDKAAFPLPHRSAAGFGPATSNGLEYAEGRGTAACPVLSGRGLHGGYRVKGAPFPPIPLGRSCESRWPATVYLFLDRTWKPARFSKHGAAR